MAKAKDRKNEGLYSYKDILHEVKATCHINDSDSDEAIDKEIRRKIKAKYKPIMMNGVYYVDRHTFECVLVDLDAYMRDRVSASDKEKYAYGKSVKDTIQEHVNEIKREEEILQAQLSEAGITKDDYRMLLSDEATLGEYVTLDELLYLGLKGIIRREDLTEEQHDELEWREAEIEAKKREDEEIEELFHRKKYEIMLEALFNERFELDTESLKKDITDYVRRGKDIRGVIEIDETTGNPVLYDDINGEFKDYNRYSKDIGKYVHDGILDITGKRSYERLQNTRLYYTPKENKDNKKERKH